MKGIKVTERNGYLAKGGSKVLTNVSSLQSPEQYQEYYGQTNDPQWDWVAESFCPAPNDP